ncbi:dehydrodolichyl diphosphate synthase 6-like protein [Tanacetum coccineum]
MEEERPSGVIGKLLGNLNSAVRRVLFTFMSTGPIPQHIAFIMDGNRRFAKKWKLDEGGGHKAGFLTLMSVLKYCYEVGVKYVTVYAFSLDNFNRRPDEIVGQHMYMGVVPISLNTSEELGELGLQTFCYAQIDNSLLYSQKRVWPRWD